MLMLSSAKATLQELVSKATFTVFYGDINTPCVKCTMGRVALAAVELAIAHFAVHVLEKAVGPFFFGLEHGQWLTVCGM